MSATCHCPSGESIFASRARNLSSVGRLQGADWANEASGSAGQIAAGGRTRHNWAIPLQRPAAPYCDCASGFFTCRRRSWIMPARLGSVGAIMAKRLAYSRAELASPESRLNVISACKVSRSFGCRAKLSLRTVVASPVRPPNSIRLRRHTRISPAPDRARRHGAIPPAPPRFA